MRKEDDIKGLAKTGWVAKLKDGKTATELDGTTWSLVKDEVVALSLVSGRKTILSLPKGKSCYFQGKTGSCGVAGGPIEIESRWIGFSSDSGDVVKATVIENNGEIIIGVSKA